MDSTRQNKIARLIQQDLGDIFLKEMKPQGEIFREKMKKLFMDLC